MRKNKTKSLVGLLLLAIAGGVLPVQAMSVDWAGTYRFEHVEVDKTSLGSPANRKSYFLNYLSLSPKIIASDGINVIAKFNVLPSTYYPDSQVGQEFGVGSNSRASSGTNPPSSGTQDSSVAGGRQRYSYLQVSQLYLSINQEYGAIVVGRAPVQFGLGLTYSAGNGPFDHWSDTRDMFGYKFVIGNLYIMPIIDRVYDYDTAQGRDVQDMIWNVEYNNPDTESIFGLWHQTRTSSSSSNDAPSAGLGGTVTGGWNIQDVNIYLARGFSAVKFRLEAGFRSGSTGVTTTAGEDVRLNGFGVGLEMDFPGGADAKSLWQLRAGTASGDNPTTANYEGFHMNRNYDVAFLLMNHPLGQYDLFRSNLQRNRNPNCTPSAGTACPAAANDQVVDEEVISNAFYFSPRWKTVMADKWDFAGTLTYAQLQTNPIANDSSVAMDAGYELDLAFIYKPTERIQWVNEVGLLVPGGAFKGGANNYQTGFNYGFQSKAAISF